MRGQKLYFYNSAEILPESLKLERQNDHSTKKPFYMRIIIYYNFNFFYPAMLARFVKASYIVSNF